MDDDCPIQILKELIRIPSQNPMGRGHSGPGWFEQGTSDWLCRFFDRHKITYRYDEIESGRGNVVARINGDPDRPCILLDAHQDTVPVAGMSIDPYKPVEQDGRLYGRGACDVKGGMSAMLATLLRLNRQDARSRANVIVSLTCDEELGQMGARDLVSRFGGDDPLLGTKPDMAIVAEPTQMNVVVAHKGVLRWRIKTPGIAVHSSRPDLGKNAIYAMAPLINGLQQLAAALQHSGEFHHRCGRPTLSVGTIVGGESVNIVPDHCSIEIDRRVVPGETFETILKQTKLFLLERTDAEFEMHAPDTECDPLVDDNNDRLATALTSIANQITGHSQIIGVAFTTQAPKFSGAGIPTVVFGPGSIDQAHTKDEWIEIAQLNQAVEILYQFIMQA